MAGFVQLNPQKKIIIMTQPVSSPASCRENIYLAPFVIHHKTSNREEILNKVAGSIKDATNGKIDLLVVTHEHTDHIDGFKLAKDIFENIEIENVWMGWTENYDDPRVKEMDKKFTLYLNALKIAQEQISHFDSSLVKKLDNLLGFYGEELGFSEKMTNRKTMKWLQNKAKSDLK